MDLRTVLGKKRLYLDGGMGTMLQRAGLTAGEGPETWNLSHPQAVTDIHAAYLAAGANIITTNSTSSHCAHAVALPGYPGYKSSASSEEGSRVILEVTETGFCLHDGLFDNLAPFYYLAIL